MQNQLGILAKHWTPGRVKTRLHAIGIENACRVYFCMLSHLIHDLRAVADRRTIVYAPPESYSEFADLAAGNWTLVPQAEGDLGQRMQSFFELSFREFKPGHSCPNRPSVVAIGADCPELDADLCQNAFSKLKRVDVVLGPTHDGGYYLIGMKQPCWEVFEGIDWGTERVLEQTLMRLKHSRISYELLPSLRDIDVPADLQGLIHDWTQNPSLDSSKQHLLNALRRASYQAPAGQ